MTAPQGRGEIRDLLARHGVLPRKRMGQHFLADPNIVRKIVDSAGLQPGDRVLEIGTGTGTLTRALAAAGATIVSYEIDEALAPLLREALEGVDADVRFADVTNVDFAEVLGDTEWNVVANLPYNVGTPLLLDLVQHQPRISRFVVMVQREVADRLVAAPGSKDFGLPSVIVQLRTDTRLLFTVRPNVFIPAPEVDSALVRLDRVPAPPGVEEAERVAAVAFRQRRKMLRASLRAEFDDPVAVLEAAGIDVTARPEELAPDDFVRLASVQTSS